MKISLMEKGVPRAIYAFKKPNVWYPVVYFRKSKHATKKEYEEIIRYLKAL